MLHSKVRAAALAGCAVGVLLIAGCGAREPVEAPPAAIEPGYGETRTPDLMGAPPSAQAAPDDGLLGGPPGAAEPPVPVATTESSLKTWRRPDGTLVTAMAPIANPEAEPRREVEPRPVRHAPVARARQVHVARTPVAAPAAAPAIHTAARPAARPAAKPTLVAKPPSRPATVAPAPAPLKPITAAAPAVAPTPAPVVPPVAPIAAPTTSAVAPAKPQTKLQALQAAVASEATKGATLATAPSLAQNQAGQVTLSLPATLGGLIRAEAARLGLAKAAGKTSAYADLRGPGYEITPSGRQTAVVKAGQPTTFAWQVKPTDAAKGPLRTEFGVALNGAKPAQGFTLGSIARRVAPVQDAVTEKTEGLNAALPDFGRYETIDVPGVGRMPTKSLLGGALVLLALLILVAISRNASAAKARTEQRRRKVRTQTAYSRNELLYDAPKSAETHQTAAAVGGAAAAHGRPEHNPFETPAQEGAAQGPHKELERVD